MNAIRNSFFIIIGINCISLLLNTSDQLFKQSEEKVEDVNASPMEKEENLLRNRKKIPSYEDMEK